MNNVTYLNGKAPDNIYEAIGAAKPLLDNNCADPIELTKALKGLLDFYDIDALKELERLVKMFDQEESDYCKEMSKYHHEVALESDDEFGLNEAFAHSEIKDNLIYHDNLAKQAFAVMESFGLVEEIYEEDI
ncbi:hypothetical protein AB6E53_02485 [Vibrio breoganii]|uniref:Uncharacterized protein n=1 Tax=Vibrio breoganii TaxID=553239 RepID=A0AAP8SWL3_9VIBR|nr:hypothetical protein [Vibrio breoganii]PMP10254.1 hypothetical protein BCS93_11300 [Vibrio breoganii]